MKKAIQKMWCGNPEPTGDWKLFEKQFHCDGVNWVVLYKAHGGFLNLKVAAYGRASHKANYWFSYKMAEKYFFGRDLSIMKENRDELYQFVLSEIDGIVAKIDRTPLSGSPDLIKQPVVGDVALVDGSQQDGDRSGHGPATGGPVVN